MTASKMRALILAGAAVLLMSAAPARAGSLDLWGTDVEYRTSQNYALAIRLSLIHICRSRRSTLCRSRWSP